jgi:hypothetical protein
MPLPPPPALLLFLLLLLCAACARGVHSQARLMLTQLHELVAQLRKVSAIGAQFSSSVSSEDCLEAAGSLAVALEAQGGA